MINKKFWFIPVLLTAISACSGKNSFDGRGAFVSGDSISIEKYAEITRIPERASERKRSAYDAFMDRSRIASYLLEGELSDDDAIKIELQEALNQKVIAAYFNKYLSNNISEDAYKAYYENNREKYVLRDFVVDRFSIRPRKVGQDTELLLEAAMESLRNEMLAGKSHEEILSAFEGEENLIVTADVGVSLAAENVSYELVDALQGLAEGGVSKPVSAMRGVQLFRVAKVTERQQSFDDVSGKIKFELNNSLKDHEYERLLKLARTSEDT
ncbi:peptidyl-prolyl cis-trans isomerase [Microbulbifer harenosus]|uniref:Peptidyl-prolyl cis-trans isomerase n=1 Tax=Microbulbifer harenosus TaxID=2576840 RepID=A0ABY2UIV5_9GAMM|nr:peptidylprolyl isomerase [Microbulbifer harenosus]TLM76760.1 peptidyl-prolyl cis-trans isomerase [Microbulbifer harenosus]